MNYPKNFDPHVNKYVFAKAIGCKPSTASTKITALNKELEGEGYLVFEGFAPVSVIAKKYKTTRETLIYFWEQLGYGLLKKEASDN